MNNYNLHRIQRIADKSLTYNKDINQHIESCKTSIEIIKEKDHIINTLRSMLIIRDEQIRNLEENNLNKNRETEELRKVITKQYKLIEELKEELKMPWLD